jgi:hypothetical protein
LASGAERSTWRFAATANVHDVPLLTLNPDDFK